LDNTVRKYFPDKFWVPQLPNNVKEEDILPICVELYADEFRYYRTVRSKEVGYYLSPLDFPLKMRQLFKNIYLLAPLSDIIETNTQIKFAVNLINQAESGFWIRINDTSMFAILCIFQVSCDLDFGNPAAGNKKAGSQTKFFCRSCMEELDYADDPEKDKILPPSKTIAMANEIRVNARNMPTNSACELLSSYGYTNTYPPLYTLKTLTAPRSIRNCRLHVLDLGIIPRFCTMCMSFLNDDGIKYLDKILRTENILNLSASHRLRVLVKPFIKEKKLADNYENSPYRSKWRRCKTFNAIFSPNMAIMFKRSVFK